MSKQELNVEVLVTEVIKRPTFEGLDRTVLDIMLTEAINELISDFIAEHEYTQPYTQPTVD